MHPDTSRHDNPFHAGEQAVHERLGIRERMVALGQRVIRTAMPEQHQRFFEQLPFILVGSVDAAGRPWASTLVGLTGPEGALIYVKVGHLGAPFLVPPSVLSPHVPTR